MSQSMVAAAREYHQPSALSAGEYDNGRCHYCDGGGTHETEKPLARFKDYLHGRRKVWMHTHTDPYPQCVTCGTGDSVWPCPTAAALGWRDGEYR